MSKTWTTEDDVLEDIMLLSYCGKSSRKNPFSNKKHIRAINKHHKSIYDDDSEPEDAKDSFRPVRGRNLCRDLKSPGCGTPLFLQHLNDTKASIREVSTYIYSTVTWNILWIYLQVSTHNFSNEYIEKVLHTANVGEETKSNAKSNLSFKNLSKDKNEQETIKNSDDRWCDVYNLEDIAVENS